MSFERQGKSGCSFCGRKSGRSFDSDRNLHTMDQPCCGHCRFLAVAKRSRAEAEAWTAEHIPSLAAPLYNLASQFEAMAEGEPKICQGEVPLPVSKWLERILK